MMTKKQLIETLKEIAAIQKRFDYDIQHSKYWDGSEASSYLTEATDMAANAVKACETKPRKKAEKKPLKQAFIIYYAADQTTTCYTEDTKTNPFKDIEEQERKNGNYYGLSAFQYKNLLEKAGYEWAWIEHNGDYGTHIREASKGYKFHGAYRGHKVGDTIKRW